MNNWGNKAGSGRLYYRIDRSDDWDAIYFSGQVAWFYNPGRRYTRVPALASDQTVITPKSGKGSIAVYGGGYPGDAAYKPPTTPQRLEKVYDMPEGQRYVASGPVTADYYWAKVWAATLPMSSHQVVKDSTPYYVVSFNHRLALVRAEDVNVLPKQPHRAPHFGSAKSAEGAMNESSAVPRSDAEPPSLAPASDMPPRDLKGME
jgi:hypothetical protein